MPADRQNPSRDITFSLPADLIRRAKIRAAEKDQSLNALVRDALESAIETRDRSKRAGERLLRRSRSARPSSDLCCLPLITISASEILQAVRFEAQFRIPFWDALILSAAESAGAEILYSEDFSHGRKYGAVRVVNPFLSRP